MSKPNLFVYIIFSVLSVSCSLTNAEKPSSESSKQDFYEQIMNSAPISPADVSQRNINFSNLAIGNSELYKTSEQVNYADYGWESRIAADWNFFDIPEEQGKILLIDIKRAANNQMAYRYLSNDTQNQLYEPWSSSKVLAFAGAMAQLRRLHSAQGLAKEALASGYFGDFKITDLITSVNDYQERTENKGSSNALASFLVNLATRDKASALFYDDWLKLASEGIFFRGAYGADSFRPKPLEWTNSSRTTSLKLSLPENAYDDPGYRSYRCDACGLTGNKPMTTLAQAEWLKRLAMHQLDSTTRQPNIDSADVGTLFYGEAFDSPQAPFGGMAAGISNMLQRALAKATENTKDNLSLQQAKSILDKASKGEWRVFQKIGWGPSETRGKSEVVVLAYVYLPHVNGGLSFVIAAQTSVDEASEQNVALAGERMQLLLNAAMRNYFVK